MSRETITIRIPADLAQWIREYASKFGVPQNSVAVMALQEMREGREASKDPRESAA